MTHAHAQAAQTTPPASSYARDLLLALLSGMLLTAMVFLNGRMASATTPVFSSVAAHVTGTVAASVALGVGLLRRRGSAAARPAVTSAGRAPFWAYLAGLSGAVTVILTSTTVNTPLALSGTLALGLAGQAGFALMSDRLGLFGLPLRRPAARELAALLLILAGSACIIFAGSFG